LDTLYTIVLKNKGVLPMEFNVYTMKHFIKQRKHLMESNYQSFGAAIKRKRIERNMTLEESAEDICSISYLSKIENSLLEPSPKYFHLLKERFDLNEELTVIDTFNDHVNTCLNYLIYQQEKDLKLIQSFQTYPDHMGLWHELFTHVFISEIKGFELQSLFTFFDLYDDIAFFIVLYAYAIYAIKQGYYQEAYDMIVPTLQSLIHNDLQKFLLHELFVEIGVHTHKDYLIMHHSEKVYELALTLEIYDKIKKVKNYVDRRQQMTSLDFDLKPLDVISRQYVSYYFQSYRLEPLEKTKDIISVILAYLKKDDAFQLLQTSFFNQNHIVIQYFKVLTLEDTSITEDFFKTYILKQSLMKYDYLTMHFLHQEAYQFFNKLNYYKDAARTYKQLFLYTSQMQRS
jgi:HTH-type transcriptional regulator, quorum sensing regulator NprR